MKVFGPSQRPVRYVSYGMQAGACSLKVPLETPPEWCEGRFQIPTRLATTEPHTNDHYEFLRLVRENFDRWIEWKAQGGMDYIQGTLKKTTPYPNPTRRTGDDTDTDTMTVSLFAQFKRRSNLWYPLDDFLENERLKKAYGIEDETVVKSWNDTTGTGDSGWVDPLVEARESRERQGLNLEDYRIPEWWDAEQRGEQWQPELLDN